MSPAQMAEIHLRAGQFMIEVMQSSILSVLFYNPK